MVDDRLIEKNTGMWLPVLEAINRALRQKPHVLVGIDGMCAAGKSSLAQYLQQKYGCGLVHADDFFLQPHQRTAKRLAEPGGNIDYERLSLVAENAADDREFSYQAYNCQTQEMGQWRKVPQGALTVMEGAYCLSPKVGAKCDVKIFLWISAKEQMRRINERNGAEMAKRFSEEWIPMENRYFAQYKIKEGCDVVINTELSPLTNN